MLQNNISYKNLACVYAIYCKVNGFRYIGQTMNLHRRVREHIAALRNTRHRNKRLQADYNHYGQDEFDFEILTTDANNLDAGERHAITQCRTAGKCYNVFSGGRSGYTGDDAFKQRASEINNGKVVSERTKQLMSANAKDQWRNEDYRQKMGASAKSQWSNPDYREMMRQLHTGNACACGHKLTEEIVRTARIRHKNGEKTSALAKEYGVTYCTMQQAINGTTWRFVT